MLGELRGARGQPDGGAGRPRTEGARIGWAWRLAGILTARTSVRCTLTNLAADGASAGVVLEWQLPSGGARSGSGQRDRGDERHQGPRLHAERFAAARPAARRPGRHRGHVLTCTLPDRRDHAAARPPGGARAGSGCGRPATVIREQAAARRRLPGRVGDAEAADPGLFGPDRIHPNGSVHQRHGGSFAALPDWRAGSAAVVPGAGPSPQGRGRRVHSAMTVGTSRTRPVTSGASAESREATRLATSAAVPNRRSSIVSARSARVLSGTGAAR